MEDEEITGEREETVCIGNDDLSVSSEPTCDIEDVESLLDASCEVSEAFCLQERIRELRPGFLVGSSKNP